MMPAAITMAAAVTIPYVAHVEVWVLVAGVLALGWYTAHVVQPKAVATGHPPISRVQKTAFVLALLGMWAASDWPVHEVAEQYLYFVHMFQHLFLSMLVPLLFVLATPRWLFELLIVPGTPVWRFFRTGSRPLVAGVVFNVLTMLLHWSRLVQLSADNGAAHFGMHVLIFVSGLLMWMPVFGPVEEWRLSPLGRCFYLFAMSIVPTVPGGWLVFAEGVVYPHYDTPDRLWGIGVLTDQQAAGVVMKLVGGFLLWAIIFFIFIRWASAEMAKDERERTERQQAAREARAVDEAAPIVVDLADLTDPTGDEVLTYEQVSREFARTPPAPEER
ncbi:MAG: cytochrome c oxidase assembly protein [Acidimicrobiia bacterium]|nr:cytochrome c oxidase assembly protein [Acidimicrobiia bacterium]